MVIWVRWRTICEGSGVVLAVGAEAFNREAGKTAENG